MTDALFTAVWQAFAAGDAMGMPTEFMTPGDIRRTLGGLPDGLIPARLSYNHGDLPTGSVTDDTEQNLYLYAEAKKRGHMTPEGTVNALKAWINETGAVEKHYIGPSSVKALRSIEEGVPPEQAGMGGTTCGGIMRTPAAWLWNTAQSENELEESIRVSLIPTHNTSEALEAAGAYGFALRAAWLGADMDGIFSAAVRGGERLIARAPYRACAPSSVTRLTEARALDRDAESLCRKLFFEWGTGLPSADVCGAVFALFAYAGKDVWLAIRMAAVLGGDTDTIAALAGALCAAYAGGHNIPAAVTESVMSVNAALWRDKLPEVLA